MKVTKKFVFLRIVPSCEQFFLCAMKSDTVMKNVPLNTVVVALFRHLCHQERTQEQTSLIELLLGPLSILDDPRLVFSIYRNLVCWQPSHGNKIHMAFTFHDHLGVESGPIRVVSFSNSIPHILLKVLSQCRFLLTVLTTRHHFRMASLFYFTPPILQRDSSSSNIILNLVGS